jgi:hypothetical protein
MYSQFDLIEELTYIAKSTEFVQTAPISILKGHVICINGAYFVYKSLMMAQSGDLLSGFSIKNVKAQVDKFKENMEKLGVKFKVIFNGCDVFADKTHFHNHCQVRKRFFHLLWKLEVMKCLSNFKEDSAEEKEFNAAINTIKTLVLKSNFYKNFVEREVSEYLYDYLFEKEIEFIIAPGRANNQIVWLYSYDYCDAILGDMSLLPFSETVPQIMADIDFEKEIFTYINIKEFSESLKLIKGKEKRQIELWSFTIPVETLTDADISILQVLDEKIKEMESKKLKLRKERSDKVHFAIDKIVTILDKLDCTGRSDEKPFAEAFQQITGDKFPKREAIILRIDFGQSLNSSCEFALSPNNRMYTMNEQEKKRLRDSFVLDFSAYKRLYSFYSFDIINQQFLLLTIKAGKYHIYFLPPVGDSKEYRNLLENFVAKDVETAFANFGSVFGKLAQINDYAMETYCTKDPIILQVKDHVNSIETGEKVFFYFKENALKQFESVNPSKGTVKTTFKSMANVVFHSWTSSPPSSEIVLSTLSLKKGGPEVNLTKREVQSLVMVNLLDDLDYMSIKRKKSMILGAALMRKGADALEEKLILLLELMRHNLLSGEFMNPPELSLLKKKKKEDKYLATSLRKTSEELKVKGLSPLHSKDDEGEVATRRKESEYKLHFDEDFNREPTIYDYEKIVNVISRTITKAKDRYTSWAKTSQILHENIDIFAHGLQDKSISKVLIISRVFCLIETDLKLQFEHNHNYLEDFDTTQYLSVLGLIQRTMRFKVEGYFSIAINFGAKGMLLKEIEEIKKELPFRTGFNGHLSNIIKVILTQYIILQQVSKGPKSDFTKSLESEFTLQHILSQHPNYRNLKESLEAGFHLFVNLMRLIEYCQDKGIDAKSSPVLELCIESKELLKEAFKRLGISE